MFNEDLTAANLPYMAGKTYWGKQLPLDDPWRPGHHLYRPLPVMMFAVEKALFAQHAWLFRLTNLLLHFLCSCLLALLIAQILGGDRAAWRAARLGALLFAVHAVHFEPIVHIVGRAELGMTTATLAALLCVERAGQSTRWLALTLILGCTATLFKEQGVLCPVVVIVYAALKRKPWSRHTLLAYSAGSLLWVVSYLLIRNYAIGGYGPPVTGLPLANLVFPQRAAVMGTVLVDYLSLLTFPGEPLLDYRHVLITHPRTFLALTPLLGVLIAVACLGILFWGCYHRKLPAALGATLVVVGLGPVSNLLLPIGAVMAERFLCLPSAGVCIWMAGLVKAYTRSRATTGLSVLVLAVMVTLCWRHSYSFADPLRAASQMAENHRDKPRLQHLAALTFEKYDHFDPAKVAWLRQKELEPENKIIDVHLTRIALHEFMAVKSGQLSGSQSSLLQGLQENLESLKPLGNLGDTPLLRGAIHYLMEEFDEARVEFLNAVFNGNRSLSSRRAAASALLEMDNKQLGLMRLDPDLIRELTEIGSGSAKEF